MYFVEENRTGRGKHDDATTRREDRGGLSEYQALLGILVISLRRRVIPPPPRQPTHPCGDPELFLGCGFQDLLFNTSTYEFGRTL